MPLYKMIRLRDLPAYVGLQRTQIDQMIAAGTFPAPIKLSDGGRAKAWLECEVLEWQKARILASRPDLPAVAA